MKRWFINGLAWRIWRLMECCVSCSCICDIHSLYFVGACGMLHVSCPIDSVPVSIPVQHGRLFVPGPSHLSHLIQLQSWPPSQGMSHCYHYVLCCCCYSLQCMCMYLYHSAVVPISWEVLWSWTLLSCQMWCHVVWHKYHWGWGPLRLHFSG